jgi:23S rRNA pseudouridine2605 synthase
MKHRSNPKRRPFKGPAKRKATVRPDRKEDTSAPVLSMDEPVRLNRYIASSGECSRREADDLIVKGQVKVNGKVVQELGTKVSHGDRVEVNGKQIAPTDREYLLLNKPKDTITTTSDEKGRRNVMDLLDLEEFGSTGLFPVGRLDRHTTGALLLTNDGDLAHRLMHPSYGVSKQYAIATKEPVAAEDMARLGQGINLEDGLAKADKVAYASDGDPRHLVMSIHEGRNRQVRRMIEAIGNEVEQLDRVLYAGLSTKGIRKGKWRRLTRAEVASLYRQVKL